MLPELRCHDHLLPLVSDKKEYSPRAGESQYFLICSEGCQIPVVNGIPRFVLSDMYASAFGRQWNAFRKTQLDSFTGTTISKDRLTRLLGGSLNIEGKNILEVGCGAGRFTEILLNAGANVFAADLSLAVEANYENNKEYPNYFVCQADLLNLPVYPEQFDVVLGIGVVQHTPNPEKTIVTLCSYVKSGGILIIDHYTYDYPVILSRRLLRSFLLRISVDFGLWLCKTLVAILWPIHEVLWKYRDYRILDKLRSIFLYISPVVDYHDSYPQLLPEHLRSWAILDTHDTLTDVYKHLRNAEEISNCLRECGMINIKTIYAGNGVEAWARKPVKPK